MINKVKEIHLLIDTSEVCFEEICTTYVETSRALKFKDIIYTTQPHFLSFRYAERLFVHINEEEHEITIGECEGTSRKIKPSHNLEKLLFAGEFEYFR